MTARAGVDCRNEPQYAREAGLYIENIHAPAEQKTTCSLPTEREVNYWRLRTSQWFDLLMTKPRIEQEYTTASAVDAFIQQTADKVKETIDQWDDQFLEVRP